MGKQKRLLSVKGKVLCLTYRKGKKVPGFNWECTVATGMWSSASFTNKHFALLITLLFLMLYCEPICSVRIWAVHLSGVNVCMGLQPLLRGLTAV